MIKKLCKISSNLLDSRLRGNDNQFESQNRLKVQTHFCTINQNKPTKKEKKRPCHSREGGNPGRYKNRLLSAKQKLTYLLMTISLLASLYTNLLSSLIDLNNLNLTSVLLKNTTPEPYKIAITLSNATEQITIPAKNTTQLSSSGDAIKNLALINTDYYHLTYGGYDAYRNNYVFRVAPRTQPKLTEFVDFIEEMQESPHYKNFIEGTSWVYTRALHDIPAPTYIAFLKHLYDKKPCHRFPPKPPVNQQPKIPLVIHQIWLGDKKNIPAVYQQWQEDLKILHPDWDYILWDEEAIKKTFPDGLYNQKMYDDLLAKKKYAGASDILRYEILNKFGGLYVDVDIQFFKSFDYLNHRYDFYAGMERLEISCFCGNSVIAAKPNHPTIKQCIEVIKSYKNTESDLKYWHFPKDYPDQKSLDGACTISLTGPEMFTQAVLETIGKNSEIDDIILPPNFFYPYPTQVSTPVSFCIHGHDRVTSKHESILARVNKKY